MLHQDLFEYKPNQKFDFIISNPPYIVEGDPHVTAWVDSNQPKEALYAADNGLEFYKYLISNGDVFLNPGGEMYFEIGFEQKQELEKFLRTQVLREYNFSKDLNGKWRFLKVRY